VKRPPAQHEGDQTPGQQAQEIGKQGVTGRAAARSQGLNRRRVMSL
jgi:hypothetical protein